MIDFTDIIQQIKGFNVTDFEKSLTQEETKRFGTYVMAYHKLALKHERALQLLDSYGLLGKLK